MFENFILFFCHLFIARRDSRYATREKAEGPVRISIYRDMSCGDRKVWEFYLCRSVVGIRRWVWYGEFSLISLRSKVYIRTQYEVLLFRAFIAISWAFKFYVWFSTINNLGASINFIVIRFDLIFALTNYFSLVYRVDRAKIQKNIAWRLYFNFRLAGIHKLQWEWIKYYLI